MAEVGWASLGIVPTFDRGFDSQLSRGLSPAIDRAGRDQGRRFGLSFGRVAVGAAAGVVGAGFAAFKFGQGAIDEASTLNESLNAVNLSYNDQAKGVKRLGRESAQALGLSNSQFNALAVRFSSFSKTIAGGEGKKVVGTLDDLTTRASDFASVMNLEVADAAGLFQSGLAGETEPLRQFGIDLSAAAVNAHAYKVGIAEAGDELTESEKVQARYSLLMKQTSQTQGDFANTSDELANQQRILSAEWDNGRAKLGTALLPIMKDATGFLLDKGIPAFERFSDWFTDKGIPAFEDFAREARPVAEEILPAIGTTAGVMRDAFRDAAPHIKDVVGFFNDMPDWAQKAIVTGGVGALALTKANKLTGGKGGVGGVSAGLLGSLKPVPVFVTNPGFGLPGKSGLPTVAGKPGPATTGGKLGFLRSLPLATLSLGSETITRGEMAAPDQQKLAQAFGALAEEVGANSPEEFRKALLSASDSQLREWRTSIREEFGVTFGQIAKSDFAQGKFPSGLTLADERQRRTAFKTLFEVDSKGVPQAEREFGRLLEQRGKLENKPISPELRLLGVARTKRQLSEIEEAAAQAAINVQDAVSNALGALSLGKGNAPTTVYNGPVTYTDDNEGRKRAQQRHRRAQSDGVRRP